MSNGRSPVCQLLIGINQLPWRTFAVAKCTVVKQENSHRKDLVADLSLKNRYLKKNLTGEDDDQGLR